MPGLLRKAAIGVCRRQSGKSTVEEPYSSQNLYYIGMQNGLTGIWTSGRTAWVCVVRTGTLTCAVGSWCLKILQEALKPELMDGQTSGVLEPIC
jgi:hypothetical protein